MRKYLAATVAIFLLTLAVPVQASTECPDPSRPIHLPPLCVSQAELEANWAPKPAPVDLRGHYVALVAKYWPAERVPWALAIILCESGFNTWAKNPRSSAAGLFQFLRSTWDNGPAPVLGLPAYWTGAPYVAEWNIQAAAWLYQNWGGKSQWSCKSAL